MNVIIIFSFFVLETVCGSLLTFGYYDAIIDEVNSGDAKWEAGLNFDPNTPLSYIKGLLGAKNNSEKLEPKGEHHSLPDPEIPEHFDSREHWPDCPTIQQIYDQGNCGSCWAIATATAFADRYCIATNGSFTSQMSVEQLLSCCMLCGEGCDGGYPYVAWKYLIQDGIVTGGEYKSNIGCQPYEFEGCEHHINGTLPSCTSLPKVKTPKCYRECTNPLYNSSYISDHRKASTAYGLENNVTEIQKEILLHGPVEAVFHAYLDFALYKSGVYHHVTGKYLGEHAVKIIGWGVEDSSPYWLVANSWNTHWGDSGFFKVLRGEDHCGIESLIVAGIPKVD